MACSIFVTQDGESQMRLPPSNTAYLRLHGSDRIGTQVYRLICMVLDSMETSGESPMGDRERSDMLTCMIKHEESRKADHVKLLEGYADIQRVQADTKTSFFQTLASTTDALLSDLERRQTSVLHALSQTEFDRRSSEMRTFSTLLGDMEDRTKVREADTQTAQGAQLTNLFAHTSAVNTRLSSLETHVSNLLGGIEQAVTGSFARLNLNDLSSTVSTCILNFLRNDQLATQQTHTELEKHVREIIVDKVSDPQAARHELLVQMLKSLPSDVHTSFRATEEGYDRDVVSKLLDRVTTIGARLDEVTRDKQSTRTSVDATTRAVTELVSLHSNGGTGFAMVRAQIESMLKTILHDTFIEQENRFGKLRDHVTSMQTQLQSQQGMMQTLHDSSKDVSSRVEALAKQVTANQSKQSHSTSLKGQQGELQLYDVLCERFRPRDDYHIERVSGLAHNCDMCIRRQGFPDVRIEVKAHGETTGAKVSIKDSSRFLSDLQTMNSHGILVSLYSGIVGRSNGEMQPLPTGKLAVFLSCNHFDPDSISNHLQYIYHYSAVVDRSTTESAGCVRMTPEKLSRVGRIVKDFTEKNNSALSHLKEVMSLLQEQQFSLIECVLYDREPLPAPTKPSRTLATPASSRVEFDPSSTSLLDRLPTPAVVRPPPAPFNSSHPNYRTNYAILVCPHPPCTFKSCYKVGDKSLKYHIKMYHMYE